MRKEYIIKSKDLCEKSLIGWNDVFADIINVLVFGGKTVVAPDSAVITHVDEFLKLMRVLTGDNRYLEISFTEQEQKEGVRMCKVLDAREKRGIKQGLQQGLQQGANQVHELMHILATQGYQLEEILAMTEKDTDREKLYKQYGII